MQESRLMLDQAVVSGRGGVFARFHHNTVVDGAIFLRNAVVGSLGCP
jgi:hypothetical protein